MAERRVERSMIPVETEDGASARVRRAIGSGRLSYLDPFLLLDEFMIAPPAGFPDHPHRGFEIITYVLDGEVHHGDSVGNHTVLRPGGLQKVRAGRGLVHSEMPGPMGGRGLQLWINLPAAHKQADPEYMLLESGEVPEVLEPSARVRLLAGEGTQVHFDLPTLYWDVTLDPGTFKRAVPNGWTLFTYGLGGTARFGAEETLGRTGEMLIWGDGDGITVRADEPARFVVVAAPALNEPIRRWGPFVD